MYRFLALSHSRQACWLKRCFLCELGFLFHNLSNAGGIPCQASNLTRIFNYLPHDERRNPLNILLETDSIVRKNTSRSHSIQELNRVLPKQTYSECKSALQQASHNDKSPAATLALSGTADRLNFELVVVSKCVCGSENLRKSLLFTVELAYVPKPNGYRNKAQGTFSIALRNSIHRESHSQSYCQMCRRVQHVVSRRFVKSLPDVININTNITNAEQRSVWTKSWLPPIIALEIHNGVLHCVQGRDAEMKKRDQNFTLFELSGIVVDVLDRDEPHLVGLIKRLGRDINAPSSPWYLMNDFMVTNVSETDALDMSHFWKTPVIATYRKVQQHSEPKLPPPDPSILLTDYNMSANRNKGNIKHRLLSTDEIPTQGTRVAIDAEFVSLQKEEVEFHSDGRKEILRPNRLSLARVSVTRAEGPDSGVPFIDDYIYADEENEPIEDYLTDYSGIKEGDLSVDRSDKTLLPSKVRHGICFPSYC